MDRTRSCVPEELNGEGGGVSLGINEEEIIEEYTRERVVLERAIINVALFTGVDEFYYGISLTFQMCDIGLAAFASYRLWDAASLVRTNLLTRYS